MENRSEAHFSIDYVLGCQIQDVFVGDSFKCLFGLHDSYGVLKGLQIKRKAFLVAASDEEGGKAVNVIIWKLHSLLMSKVQNRLRAEASVHVVMKFHLGNQLDYFF